MTVRDYDLVFEAAPSALVVLDRDYRMLAFNRAFRQLTGADDKAIGVGILVYFDEAPERKARFAAAYDRAFAGGDVILERETYAIGTADPSDPKREERWWTMRATPIGPAPAARIVLSIEERSDEVRALAMAAAVTQELEHRVGNLSALVSVIARQTARTATDVDSYARDLVARIETLAHATRLLSRTNWRGARIRDLVDTALAPFDGFAEARVRIEGPEVTMDAAAGQALVMGLHELATNAAKYGALAMSTGRIEISWAVESGGGASLAWQESGVGPVSAPEQPGFGTTILTHLLPTQLGGEAVRTFGPDGLTYRIDIGAAHVVAAGEGLDTGRTGTYL